jgi:hypothetical protein
LFEASRSLAFFDHFRIPYRVQDDGPSAAWNLPERHPLQSWARAHWNRGPAPHRVVYWPRNEDIAKQAPVAQYSLDSIPIFGRVVPDTRLIDLLTASQGHWQRDTPILEGSGNCIASVWRDENGNIVLPFDPDEVLKNFWSEGYRSIQERRFTTRARKASMLFYYRIRPWMPHATQILLRRFFIPLQSRQLFPAWPLETALQDLFAWLFGRFTQLAQEGIPWIAPWPQGYSWALVLTHDVETQSGYDKLGELKSIEIEAGLRSSWNFVPKRYPVDDSLVRELLDDGFEVGVHGLYHDGRDLQSLALLNQRLPGIRVYAKRWEAVGFRSPSTHRMWEWMPLLGFDYDSSYADTDPYEPQPGGCCSLWPFFNQDMVELPITLPQDHTLFVLLGHLDEGLWIKKARQIKSHNGMVLLDTHPDYTAESPAGVYQRFLSEFHNDPTAWRALPKEVSAWWRRRAHSYIVFDENNWSIQGEAAKEARIEFTRLAS